MAKLVKQNFVVVKGESRSESGLVCTMGWKSFESALRLSGWLKPHESVEKVRLVKDGLDVFIDTEHIQPSNLIRRVKEKK